MGCSCFFSFLHFYLPVKEEAPRGDEVTIILLLQWLSTSHDEKVGF